MAVKSRKSSAWQTLHFLVRFLGLTGLIGACAGWFIWTVLGDEWLGTIVVGASAAVVALALLFEVGPIAQAAASRRGAFGFNAFLQIALIVVLVVAANIYSFETFKRFDLTRERLFTLDDKITKQLAQMRDDTEIIVLQQYVSFGQRSEHKQDKYDFAAQRKIIEKVKDLVEQFRDFNPRFRVTVLFDVQDDNYQQKLEEVGRHISKDLRRRLHRRYAPENSIFFYSKQQKADSTAQFQRHLSTRQAKARLRTKTSYCLKFQGVEPFAPKIHNIEEKRPRIATAIVHPVLGLQNREEADVHDERRQENPRRLRLRLHRSHAAQARAGRRSHRRA